MQQAQRCSECGATWTLGPTANAVWCCGVVQPHNQDIADIITARSRYNARKTESSLIAWICSDEWSNPELAGVLFGRDGAPWVDWTARGKVRSRTWGGDEANTISGEIGE